MDFLADALEAIAAGRYRGDYVQDRASGEFAPAAVQPDPALAFSLARSVDPVA